MDKALELLINNNISKSDYIVVGCSGGPDSMCLLNLLHLNDYKIVCAHVNHNIRAESAAEYKFLKKYCDKNKIIFEGLELEKSNHNESYYRKKRYTFYKALANKYKTKYIMTAHHGDDLIETVLMRISRGSTLKGYIGFPKIYKEYEYVFVKPLIFYTKDEILKYNECNNIPFVLDKTNEEDSYKRNRYRHHILPFLKEEDSNIHRKFLQFSDELEEASDYIINLVQRAKTTNYKDNQLDLKLFFGLDSYIKKKELQLILSELYKDSIDKVNKKHTTKILDLLTAQKNFKISLPDDIIVKREYDVLYFTKENECQTFNIELTDQIELPNGDVIRQIKESFDTSNYVTRLNSKDIKLPLYIRTRCDGDSMCIKNMNGSKKIKSIFIDDKVKSQDRMSWPVMVDASNQIVWLPGLRKSKFDVKNEGKYDIILEYEKKGKN